MFISNSDNRFEQFSPSDELIPYDELLNYCAGQVVIDKGFMLIVGTDYIIYYCNGKAQLVEYATEEASMVGDIYYAKLTHHIPAFDDLAKQLYDLSVQMITNRALDSEFEPLLDTILSGINQLNDCINEKIAESCNKFLIDMN